MNENRISKDLLELLKLKNIIQRVRISDFYEYITNCDIHIKQGDNIIREKTLYEIINDYQETFKEKQ